MFAVEGDARRLTREKRRRGAAVVECGAVVAFLTTVSELPWASDVAIAKAAPRRRETFFAGLLTVAES